MRQFGSVERFVRHNFLIYRFVRGLAPTLCKWFSLEDGFDFLSQIEPIPGFTAIDAGANDGTSIRMIRKYHKEVYINCFDPITRPSFKLKDVSFYNLALGKTKSNLVLFTPTVKEKKLTQYSSFQENSMLRQVAFDLNISSDAISVTSKTVEVRTLDEFEIECFFLKIDVEGTEIDVVLGGLATIGKFKPIILVELQNKESYELMSLHLSKIGYINIRVKGFVFRDSDYIHQIQTFSPEVNNYVWIPKGTSISWRFKN